LRIVHPFLDGLYHPLAGIQGAGSLQTWSRDSIRKSDARVSKNYLAEPEIAELNRLTTILLDIFEDQLDLGRLVIMEDARRLLDQQLEQLGRAVLHGGGSVSASDAKRIVDAEYAKYDKQRKLERHPPSLIRHPPLALSQNKSSARITEALVPVGGGQDHGCPRRRRPRGRQAAVDRDRAPGRAERRARFWSRSRPPASATPTNSPCPARTPKALFPAILGHEGAGVVVDVGPGVTSLKKGDHVIPLYTPECRECDYCLHPKTNLCQAIRSTQGQGLMPDGTSRFSIGGKLLHYMGTSTFANHTVLPEIALAKIREDAPFDKVCYIGCGVTTGIGAVINTAKVEPGSKVVVFGLGGIGLNVIQGARMVGANMIVGVDLNPTSKAWAEKFGMTHFVNPRRCRWRSGGPSGGTDRRRRRLFLRVHRQRRPPCARPWNAPTRAGARASSSASPARGRKSPPARSSWSPAGVARHRLRRRARPHRRAARSSTGTWTARSTSTR
jgi:hypothetical protein